MRRLLLIALAACGGTAPPSTGAPHVALIATAAAKDDVIVAQVDGRPVWGSCVTAQSLGTTRDAALRQCIDFELLAQAAEARGLATDPGVQDALHTELVERFVEKYYEDKFAKPSDLGKIMDKVVDDNLRALHRPESRASTYVRVKLAADAPAARDALAHQLADKLAARVRDETGLFAVTLAELTDPVKPEIAAAGFEYERSDVPTHQATKLVKPYADALFAIPEVGRTAGPIRTEWGWDVILYTGGTPAAELTRDDLAAEVFPDLRRSYFDVWAREVQKKLGAKVELVDENLAKLDKLEIGGVQ